jgi:hypothetical protein
MGAASPQRGRHTLITFTHRQREALHLEAWGQQKLTRASVHGWGLQG